MNKQNFLDDNNTANFTDWLALVIAGTKNIHFTHAAGVGGTDATLEAAKNRYCWPKKRTEIIIPGGSITLNRDASLQKNQEVLDALSKGIRESLETKTHNEEDLAGWVRAIMVWGGVYTKKKNGGGNAGWLEEKVKKGGLAAYLKRILLSLDNPSGDLTEGDLRSNAGTTKVHALILKDFIIYDSRVAAALAWLVQKWASECRVLPIATHLRFACMKANTSITKPKIRSPDEAIFPYFVASGDIRKHRMHATWNLRANWVLRAALDKAMKSAGAESAVNFQSVRDVEAALFTMGANLQRALPRA